MSPSGATYRLTHVYRHRLTVGIVRGRLPDREDRRRSPHTAQADVTRCGTGLRQALRGNSCGYVTVFRDDDIYRMYYRGSRVDYTQGATEQRHPEEAISRLVDEICGLAE